MSRHGATEPLTSPLELPASVDRKGSRSHDAVRPRQRRRTTTLPRDPVLDHDRQRADRIVATYVAAAAAWIVLSSSITDLVATVTPWTPTTIEITKGLLFVAATALLLRVALRRWARRLVSAAELEQRAADDLLAVARLRAAFLASISHELRTPLTNIVGYAHTIRTHHRALPDDQIDRFAERLAANSERLERLVVDLLELHQPTLDHEVVCEPVQLGQLLDEVVRASGSPDHDIRSWSAVTWVEVDRTKVERLVEELVHNVSRHTPPGTCAWVTATHEDGWLDLTVEDDGPGLDPALQAAATEPFVQGTHVDGLPSPGLGIGLALVARYAELLGGGIAVTEPAGGGTRVTVAVPARVVDSRIAASP